MGIFINSHRKGGSEYSQISLLSIQWFVLISHLISPSELKVMNWDGGQTSGTRNCTQNRETNRKSIKSIGSNLQDFRCRSAQNHLALFRAQAQFLDHFHWAIVANREAIIAAHHDSIDAHLGDDELHQRF
jgi:hypothetical protein